MSGENESRKQERESLKPLSRITVQPASTGTSGDAEW